MAYDMTECAELEAELAQQSAASIVISAIINGKEAFCIFEGLIGVLSNYISIFQICH